MSEDKQMPKYWNAAVADVINERVRQIEVEHWTADHDDHEYDGGDLICAGICAGAAAYAIAATDGKPAEPRRLLFVKAAALLIAEIERLDRKERR